MDKETELKQKIILYYNLNVDIDDFSFNQKINNQNIIFKYIVDNAKNEISIIDDVIDSMAISYLDKDNYKDIFKLYEMQEDFNYDLRKQISNKLKSNIQNQYFFDFKEKLHNFGFYNKFEKLNFFNNQWFLTYLNLSYSNMNVVEKSLIIDKIINLLKDKNDNYNISYEDNKENILIQKIIQNFLNDKEIKGFSKEIKFDLITQLIEKRNINIFPNIDWFKEIEFFENDDYLNYLKNKKNDVTSIKDIIISQGLEFKSESLKKYLKNFQHIQNNIEKIKKNKNKILITIMATSAVLIYLLPTLIIPFKLLLTFGSFVVASIATHSIVTKIEENNLKNNDYLKNKIFSELKNKFDINENLIKENELQEKNSYSNKDLNQEIIKELKNKEVITKIIDVDDFDLYIKELPSSIKKLEKIKNLIYNNPSLKETTRYNDFIETINKIKKISFNKNSEVDNSINEILDINFNQLNDEINIKKEVDLANLKILKISGKK